MQQKQTLWRRYMPVLLFVLILVIFSLLPSSPAVWRDVRRACGLGTFSDAVDRAPFAFHVLDVGKADSLLLECAGEAMLVDGGTPDQGAGVVPVSYTHLDVYKRQPLACAALVYFDCYSV